MKGKLVFLALSTSLLYAEVASGSQSCGDLSRTPLNSFLWTIHRPGAPVYFFGTIHVPYTRVWDYIPQNAKDAFRNSENVFFELDLTNHYTAAQLASCQLLPGGETLESILPRDLYRRLKKHFNYLKRKMPEWLRPAQRGRTTNAGERSGPRSASEAHPMYADYQFNAMAGSWERMRPVWVMLTLNSLTESEVRSFGVPVLDLYLSQQAVRWNKLTGAIEKVEEQCAPLNQLNLSQVIFALNQTLLQHEMQREYSVSASLNDDLIHHYSCGDLDSVLFSRDVARVPAFGMSSASSGRPAAPSLGAEQSRMAREIDGYFQTELLYKRNERMAERVAALLRSHPKRSFFFAFGAGHFLGYNTVIDHLRNAGFVVDHLPAQTNIASESEKDFTNDLNVPVALNPYIEALTSFNQLHSGKIRQKLHKQGRRQQQDSSSALWHETKRERQRDRASTTSSFNSLWKRIGMEGFTTSEPETSTADHATRSSRIWHPGQSSSASSAVSYAELVTLVLTMTVGTFAAII